MNRLIVFIISIFFLTQCSVSEKINPWKGKEKKIEKIKKKQEYYQMIKKSLLSLTKI